MKSLKNLSLSAITLLGSTFYLSSCNNESNDFDTKTDYDILQINGDNYACYGYRCTITYTSDWDLSSHSGVLRLPCGKISDAEKGEYDYDYMYSIYLEGDQDLKRGSKLEDFSPTFQSFGEWKYLDYVSGSATITDIQNDKYLTVKFASFSFEGGSKSYILNGTVQLDLDEDF